MKSAIVRRVALLGTALAAALSLGLTAPTQADTITIGTPPCTSPPPPAGSTPFVINGTSDVSDSDLMRCVIEPGFEKAFPQFDLQYVPNGTGTAIQLTKQGTGSALIVHAASLENQLVAEGYSLEKYGRAIFWGDFVLLGPASDPAGVMTNASHDVVQAFEDIAAAGEEGKATFVSRGGTPGTTVSEHGIWALTSGVQTCTVTDADGGGTTPSTTGGDCPAIGSVTTPDWYQVTGSKQAANIQAANACSMGHDDCYVYTDRGTFDSLASQGLLPNLQVVTRDNAASAVGGSTLLVNSFHAYAVNPAKFADQPDVTINAEAAKDFLNWVTSPAAQAAVGTYLADVDSAPFLPSASPSITVTKAPKKVAKGAKVTIKGKVANVVPGTPALGGVVVRLSGIRVGKSGPSAPLAKAKTNAKGVFTIKYKATRSMRLTLSTGKITKIENASLDPVFGDILAPSTANAGTVKVTKKAVKR
jgi:tungstate transport system substrate-binding protein